jgi:hypothetical protein
MYLSIIINKYNIYKLLKILDSCLHLGISVHQLLTIMLQVTIQNVSESALY